MEHSVDPLELHALGLSPREMASLGGTPDRRECEAAIRAAGLRPHRDREWVDAYGRVGAKGPFRAAPKLPPVGDYSREKVKEARRAELHVRRYRGRDGAWRRDNQGRVARSARGLGVSVHYDDFSVLPPPPGRLDPDRLMSEGVADRRRLGYSHGTRGVI